MPLNTEKYIILKRQKSRTNLFIENGCLSKVETENISELLSFPDDLSITRASSTESLKSGIPLVHVIQLKKEREINSRNNKLKKI